MTELWLVGKLGGNTAWWQLFLLLEEKLAIWGKCLHLFGKLAYIGPATSGKQFLSLAGDWQKWTGKLVLLRWNIHVWGVDQSTLLVKEHRHWDQVHSEDNSMGKRDGVFLWQYYCADVFPWWGGVRKLDGFSANWPDLYMPIHVILWCLDCLCIWCPVQLDFRELVVCVCVC